MAERKGQDGQRFEDTPSLNIAMGEWGSEVHRSLHDVLFRVTHVLKFFLWRVVDSAIQACGGVRGTLGRMTNGALNRAERRLIPGVHRPFSVQQSSGGAGPCLGASRRGPVACVHPAEGPVHEPLVACLVGPPLLPAVDGRVFLRSAGL